jgi:hypothetical protein
MSTNFRFTAVPSDREHPLGLTVKHNDQTVFDTDCLADPQTVNIKIDDDIDNVEHKINIILKNKTTDHTKIDEQGCIIADSLISISNISLDDIEIDQLFFEKSQYTHSFNSDLEPVSESFYGNLGCNGVVEFKFSTPTYIWLLENL